MGVENCLIIANSDACKRERNCLRTSGSDRSISSATKQSALMDSAAVSDLAPLQNRKLFPTCFNSTESMFLSANCRKRVDSCMIGLIFVVTILSPLCAKYLD